MGLTMGTGPFGKQPAGTFNFEPDRAQGPRSLPRAVAAAGARRDRRRDRRRLDRRRPAARDRLPAHLVLPALRRALRPARGDRSHDALPVQGRRELLDDPRRRQAAPRTRSGAIPRSCRARRRSRDRVAFYWDAVDHWYEEDEEVFVHPRDPYHRVDLVPSSRTVRISLDGVVLAESSRPLACFETNLPTRWYLPKEDSSRPTSRRRASRAAPTRAPRRTGAWAATRTSRGATRTRSRPLRRCSASSSFYDEVVDVDIDGERQERGYSPFAQAGALRTAARGAGREQRIAMSTAQVTRTVTLERRTDIDLESFRRVAREGAGIAIGEGAAERMRAARDVVPRARRERPRRVHLRRHDERRRRRLDAARRRSAAQPRAHARPLGRVLRRAAAGARRARHGA